ncbi:polysaccharide deacetylase family protein [Lutimonas halocynthiae]|uniref:polysaccharide deacetylase family protein n=1 Tax=Lutimonas halocynthiae TaxID=1446477 RepID=UPI0025B41A0B|nr:polysaccharide deacetylase family protein [Lutimonas halocynthiae]MDN3642038.1 polysaccharide deacetylase family protein [Lutimonas halocynthiae]
MRKHKLIKFILVSIISGLLFTGCTKKLDQHIGQTEVTKWQGNKKAAVSITYDDGIITQFTVARPIMNKLNLPGTFFILTGKLAGAAEGRFIGRSKDEIIRETASTKTDETNFFERASLIGFTGFSEGVLAHSNAGSLFEAGKITEAYQNIDTAYEKLRRSRLKNTEEVVYHDNPQDTTRWEDLRKYATEGHEIASHSITHPRMAVLDEANLLYELEQSKAEIYKNLGEQYTFSVECPYGTENERVMEYARSVYPALRNRMPETYLDEINRSSDDDPEVSKNEYVQWQRGPLTNSSMDLMKSWIDKCVANNNIWLVLVFHGVDNFGWEPKTAGELETYFTYIKENENNLWVATFADVTKYIRERKSIEISSKAEGDTIILNFTSDLDPETYDVPLTLKTYIPNSWEKVEIRNAENVLMDGVAIHTDKTGTYVLYYMIPQNDKLFISSLN